MEDKEFWKWAMRQLEAGQIADVAVQDQMLAARRDFEPVLPLMDEEGEWGELYEGAKAIGEALDEMVMTTSPADAPFLADIVEEDDFSNITFALKPSNRQTFRLRRVPDLTTNFGMDESYAREANEFGY